MARRQTKPIVFMMGIFVLAMVIVSGSAMIIKKFEGKGVGIGAPVLQTFACKDGSTITLHSVSIGTTHPLDVNVKRRHAVIIFENGYYTRTAHKNTQQDRMVIWFSRTRADGTPMDVDWWSHCSIEDANGAEIRDGNAERFFMAGWSMDQDRAHNGRPLPPQTGHRYYRADERIYLATSEFPLIQSQGDLTLKIFEFDNPTGAGTAVEPDTSVEPINEVEFSSGRANQASIPKRIPSRQVAQFTIPNPATQPTEVWTADEVPVAKSSEGVTLRLNKFEGISYRRTYLDATERRRRLTLHPTFQFLNQDGTILKDYVIHSQELFDPIGNQSGLSDIALSQKDAVWKLRVSARRHANAEFTPEEKIEFDPIEIPPDNLAKQLNASFSNAKTSVTAARIAGRGKVSYTYSTSTYLSGSSSSSGSLNNARYEFKIRTRSRVATVTAESPFPHLQINPPALPPGHQVTYRVKDDQGREVGMRHIHQYSSDFWMLAVEPDAKSLHVTAVIQEPVEFHFYVKPPEFVDVEELRKKQAADRQKRRKTPSK